MEIRFPLWPPIHEHTQRPTHIHPHTHTHTNTHTYIYIYIYIYIHQRSLSCHKWTREELQQMDQKIRKQISMHKALHPRDDIDRLYLSRKEGGRELARNEDGVDASIWGLEDWIKKSKERLITAIKSITRITNNNNNKETEIERKRIVWIFQATNERNLTRKDRDGT